MESPTQEAVSRSAQPGPSRLTMITGVSVIVVVTFAAVATQFLSAEAADIVGPLGVLLGYATAGVIISRGAMTLEGREQTAWRLVGAGFSSGALGVLAVALVSGIAGTAPAFGPTDLFFVAAYVLVLAGLVSMPHVTGSTAQRLRVSLDGLIGAISIAALLWAFVLRDLLASLDGAPDWERWMGSTYPILDIAMIITVMIVVMRRSIYRFDVRLLVLGTGLAAQAVGDLTYLVSGVGKTFEEANPFYPLFLFGGAAYIVTGLLLYRKPVQRHYADRGTPWWAMVAPYGAAALMVVVVVSHIRDSTLNSTNAGLLVATIVVGGLVIARQAVAIHENRKLVDSEREALVSSISHELRTPLTSMVGFVDLMADQAEARGEGPDEMITIVQEQSAYMARIVEDLMMLARNDPSSMELRDEAFDVRQLINAAIRAADVEPGSVDVECDPMLRVVMDRNRLQQTLVNLLSNAVRYGGPRRLITAHDSEGSLAIEVHDDGHGVPRKHELSIWHRFERGSNRLNGAIPGSGIGLAIVDAVATAYNGTTGYRRSDRLGGACFWVDLPGRVAAMAAHRESHQDILVDMDDLGPLDGAAVPLAPSSHEQRRSF